MASQPHLLALESLFAQLITLQIRLLNAPAHRTATGPPHTTLGAEVVSTITQGAFFFKVSRIKGRR
jgi:hypothetical protein